jgi:hypothetical protein
MWIASEQWRVILPTHPEIDAVSQNDFYFSHEDSNREAGQPDT